MSEEPKKFGLRLTQKPGAASTAPLPVASVFGDEADSDTEIANEKDANKKFQMKYGSNRTRDQRAVDEAIAEDPDVYKYDEILDDLHSKRNAKTEEQKEADKKREPKYAHKIVLATQKRQMEKLMVDERKQAKEREAEGEEFKDKEAFVTGAYKKQIEEREKIRKELEEQDRMDSRLKVEDQSFWQANFNRRLLDDMTDEKPAVKVEEKKEKVVEKEEEDFSREEEKEKKLFQDLKPGLNQPKSSTKPKRSPSPEHRTSRRDRDHRRRHSSSYDRKRSSSYKDRSHHRRRRHDSSASSSSSAAASRSPSPAASKENGSKENRRHEKKKSNDTKPKSDKEILYERLEKVKEILKQRNSESEIFMARQRYLQRKQNGEIRAPI